MATWTTRVDERPEGAELSIADEPHTVGEELAGYVLLLEVPRLRSPSTVSIRRASDDTALAEVSSTPAAGQFRVVYGPRVRFTGAVEFAPADAGLAVLVSYEGTGSAVWARDVNRLQSEKVDRDGTIPFTGNVGIGREASGWGIHQLGGGHRLEGLGAPDVSSTPVGLPGSMSYTYYVVAEDRNGRRGAISAARVASGSNVTLSATNYNRITWSVVPGAVWYHVLKGSTGALLGSTTATWLNDVGQATTPYTPPTRNESADMFVDGALGIGTTGPTERLHVSGNAHVTGYGSFGTTVAGTTALSVQPANAAHTGLLVKGLPGQTGSLAQWQKSDGTVLSQIRNDGAWLHNNPLVVTTNAQALHLVGTDSAYLALSPRGSAAGRKAWIGFGAANGATLTVNNEDAGPLVLATQSGQPVEVTQNLFVRGTGSSFVTGKLAVGAYSTPTHGVHVFGGGLYLQKVTMSAVTATTQGTAGTTTYHYRVVPLDRAGRKAMYGAATIATGNATLNATNFVRLVWGAVFGAASYDVLRSTNGITYSLIGNTGATTFDDTGQAATAYTLPTRNSTADLVVDGAVVSYATGTVAGEAAFTAYGVQGSDTAIILAQPNVVHWRFKNEATTGQFVLSSGLTSFGKKLVVTTGGDVGIGTGSPTAKLDVAGTAKFGSGSSSQGSVVNVVGAPYNQVNITHAGSSAWGLLLGFGDGSATGTYHGSNHAALINVQAAPLHLGTSNEAWVTISAAGGVGIGTASPAYRLHLVHTGYTDVACFQSSHTLGTWLTVKNTDTGGREIQIISTGSGNGTGAGSLILNGALSVAPGGDNVTGLGTNGLRWTAVYAVNGAIQTSSRAEKELHGELDPAVALRTVREIPVHRYTYRHGGPLRHVGIVIDELPRWMWTDPEGKGFNYNTLTSVNTAAIRGLSEHVDDEVGRLKHRVAELEREVAALRGA